MTATTVAQSIQRVRDAARALGEARAYEQALEDERPLVKRDAIRALLQTANDLTGKPHSASSAETVVESHEPYAAHRRRQAEAVLAAQVAWGEFKAAELEATLAVALAADGAIPTVG